MSAPTPAKNEKSPSGNDDSRSCGLRSFPTGSYRQVPRKLPFDSATAYSPSPVAIREGEIGDRPRRIGACRSLQIWG